MKVIKCIVLGLLFTATGCVSYNITQYFPLDEGDKYYYAHYEGGKAQDVSITVQNVSNLPNKKEFEFLWEGEFNDRIQKHFLSKNSWMFYENRHLVGELPLKSVRTLTPPLAMIPSKLGKISYYSSLYSTYDYDGNLIEEEIIDADISFVGKEQIKVPAGDFECLHFFIRHNYKDVASDNSKHMHTYNIWIAKNVGIVKFVHIFVPFIYDRHLLPEDKNINVRYNTSFIESFDLKKAVFLNRIVEE